MWRKRYLEAKKITPRLEEECSRLRQELEKLHRELLAKVQAGVWALLTISGKTERPSNKVTRTKRIIRNLNVLPSYKKIRLDSNIEVLPSIREIIHLLNTNHIPRWKKNGENQKRKKNMLAVWNLEYFNVKIRMIYRHSFLKKIKRVFGAFC